MTDPAPLATPDGPSGAPSGGARDRPDLSSRADVHDLVVGFYREVVLDELLEPLFSEIAEVDWTEHLPKLVDYWCSILLRSGERIGPVMRAHREVHERSPIRIEHCDRWFALWTATIDSRWSGPVAGRAATHAAAIMSGLARHVFDVEWAAPDGRQVPR